MKERTKEKMKLIFSTLSGHKQYSSRDGFWLQTFYWHNLWKSSLQKGNPPLRFLLLERISYLTMQNVEVE